MGDYTRIGLVASATGFSKELTPSGTVNNSIRWGEATMKKYLRLTPATGSAVEPWVEMAATAFGAYMLSSRLASQNIANVRYQRQDAARGRSSDMIGHSMNAQAWYEMGINICNMHGRDIIIQRVTNT